VENKVGRGIGMLDTFTRRAIQKSVQVSTRKYKKQLFREVNECLKRCDHCPFKDLGLTYEKEGVLNPYEVACGSCDTYTKMRTLGDYLWNAEISVQFLLQKGQDLTADEVFYLLEIGAKKKDIQKALGFKYPKQLRDYIAFYEGQQKIAK
jgi:hypothetical protein